MLSKTEVGAKVYAKINGQNVPAVVLETAFSAEGNYLQTRLRIAVKNNFTGQWMTSNYPKPVQSYKLTMRFEMIPELDKN